MHSRMSRRAGRIAMVALIVSIASALFGSALGAPASADDVPAQPNGYALVKANFGLTPGAGFFLDETHIRAGLDDFETLGVHWIRSSIPWKNFEPNDPDSLAPGAPEFNWKGVDQFAATLEDPAYQGRFDIIVTVDSPPNWATQPSHIGPIPCDIAAPFDLAAYANAMAALAERLKDVAHVFEVENSPNIGTRSPAHPNPLAPWSPPNPCGYTQLLKLTTAAVHGLNIGAQVLVGGLGGVRDVPNQRIAADEFLADLYANGARGAFDGVSYHPYSTPYLPCDPADVICVFNPDPIQKDPYGLANGWDRMLNARKIMVANHDGYKQIWITEFGGPTEGPDDASKVLTEREQAQLLVAGFQRASQYPWVAEMCWFTYDDKGTNPQTDPGGGFMGLLREDGSQKPSYFAYQRMTSKAL